MSSGEGFCAGLMHRRYVFGTARASQTEDADKGNYVVSYKKINSLGFATSISLEEGIDELVRALQVISVQNPYSNA